MVQVVLRTLNVCSVVSNPIPRLLGRTGRSFARGGASPALNVLRRIYSQSAGALVAVVGWKKRKHWKQPSLRGGVIWRVRRNW